MDSGSFRCCSSSYHGNRGLQMTVVTLTGCKMRAFVTQGGHLVVHGEYHHPGDRLLG